ncbi:NICE-3 domain containing protein [Trichuris trichiura]|uniref:NICE-3 domain containing protein n=1 Tax=Trichuris trichiura TaxID=36087 RepID=A0A077ZC70_TRITR|nr:NICE-3 domain containing protein [Trichuris trichiura]
MESNEARCLSYNFSTCTNATGHRQSGSSANVISGITAIYLICVGVQFFILAFILGRRQVLRLSWASRKAPHMNFAQGAPANFRAKIHAGLRSTCLYKELPMFTPYSDEAHPQWYRYKVLDEVNVVLRKLQQMSNFYKDSYSAPLDILLHRLMDQDLCPRKCTADELNEFVEIYERARYKRQEVVKDDYDRFHCTYNKLFVKMKNWPCVGHQRLLSCPKTSKLDSSEVHVINDRSGLFRRLFRRPTLPINV